MSDYCEHCHRKFRYTNAGDAFCLTANCPNNLDHLMAELHTVRAERDTLREALQEIVDGFIDRPRLQIREIALAALASSEDTE